MIFKYILDFFSNFSSVGAGPTFGSVVFGFVGLSALGLVITLIKKIKGFAFIGG